MRQYNFIYFVILLIFLTACWTPSSAKAGAPLSRKVIKATEVEFNQVARAIRPEHPLVPTNFIENEGELYYYVIPRRLQRLCQDGHRFTIKKIRIKTIGTRQAAAPKGVMERKKSDASDDTPEPATKSIREA